MDIKKTNGKRLALLPKRTKIGNLELIVVNELPSNFNSTNFEGVSNEFRRN